MGSMARGADFDGAAGAVPSDMTKSRQRPLAVSLVLACCQASDRSDCPDDDPNIPDPSLSDTPMSTPTSTIAAATLAVSMLSGCDPCGPEIVQVSPTWSEVLIRNTCAGDIDLEPLALRFGITYGQNIYDLKKTMPGGACERYTVLGLPSGLPIAFGIAVFEETQNVLSDKPWSSVIWGGENTGLLMDDDGATDSVDAKSIALGTTLTKGSAGWYEVPNSDAHIACETWGHEIEVSTTNNCVPHLVEVHPGPTPLMKLSLPPWCEEPVSLSGYALGWGRSTCDRFVKLDGQLSPGEDLVVGEPLVLADNGWPQWGTPGFRSAPAMTELSSATSGFALAALYKGGEAIGGVAYGPVKKLWPNLDNFAGGVPAGKSLRWTGSTWELGPASPNQAPDWRLVD